jgi:hypothetical protein
MVFIQFFCILLDMGPDFATCPGFALSCLRYLKMTFGYLWRFYDVGNLHILCCSFFGGEPRRNPQAFPKKGAVFQARKIDVEEASKEKEDLKRQRLDVIGRLDHEMVSIWTYLDFATFCRFTEK